MTSLLDARPGVRGTQRPRLESVPQYVSSTGDEAIELAAMAGLDLDDWQQYVLVGSLGERPDGQWASPDVGVVVPRQNGKGGIIEARELSGLYVIGERLITHTAHQFDTSLEAFQRLLNLIDDTPELSRRVKKVSHAHGSEGITLVNGQRIRFRTRTKGGGRGFTGDCVILDEAMELSEASIAALYPTIAARPNPQVWYLGSAVDQQVHENGIVFARVRERGLEHDPNLAYFEHSADLEIDKIGASDVVDPDHWAAANPALGIRISTEYIARELKNLGIRKFAVERLGVGDWPRTDLEITRKIEIQEWNDCVDETSSPEDPVCFAFDVTIDRSYSSIAVAGIRADKLSHVELVSHGRGTRWVAPMLARLSKRHRPGLILCDAKGPAGALIPDIEALGIEVTPVTAAEHGQACGIFLDDIKDDRLRHLGQLDLDSAVDGAQPRVLGDAWVWGRKDSSVDISPLVAVTIARWGVAQKPKLIKPRVINLNSV